MLIYKPSPPALQQESRTHPRRSRSVLLMIHLPIIDGRRLAIIPANYPMDNCLEEIVARFIAWCS